MRKLPIPILSLLLFPAIASAQSAEPPPPPPDAQDVEMARPSDAEPDMQPPAPPAVPQSRAQASGQDQAGVLQASDDAYREQQAPASPPPQQTGQWVYTSQYGWVWMPYGRQYVDEGTYGGTRIQSTGRTYGAPQARSSFPSRTGIAGSGARWGSGPHAGGGFHGGGRR